MSNIYNPFDSPSKHVEYLLRYFENPEIALDHAHWAYENVHKPESKDFWAAVIEGLNKTLNPKSI